MSISDLSRRDFIKAAGATAAVAIATSYSPFSYAQNEKVRIGCIGIGNQGAFHIRNGLMPAENLEIVAICDVLKMRIEAAYNFMKGDKPEGPKTYMNYREMLEKEQLDGVIISTPLYTHHQIVMDCLNAGKFVFCEKTLCYAVEQCREIVQKCQDTGLFVQVGHQRRYHPDYNKALWLIRDKGLLGRINHINAHWHRNSDWRFVVPKNLVLSEEEKQFIQIDLEHWINWRIYKEYSGGLMTELAAHHIDIANWYLGGPPKRVFAMGGIDYWRDGRDVEDNCVACFEYEVDRQNPAFTGINRRNEFQNLAKINQPYTVRMDYSAITANAKRGEGMSFHGDKGTIELTETAGSKLFAEMAMKPKEEKKQDAAGAAAATMSGQTYIPDEAFKNGYKIEITNDRDVDCLQMEAFANCIKTKETPKANQIVALHSAIAALMGSRALMERTTIEIDPAWTKFDFPTPDPFRYEDWPGPFPGQAPAAVDGQAPAVDTAAPVAPPAPAPVAPEAPVAPATPEAPVAPSV